VQQVEYALRLGLLKPGDQLPTVKGTVAALAINPNTVLKAYRELEPPALPAAAEPERRLPRPAAEPGRRQRRGRPGGERIPARR
jgi:DNA-binding transcriptional MocR family regulator